MANSFVLRVILNLFLMASFFPLSINSEPTYVIGNSYSGVGTYDFSKDNIPANITNLLTQFKKQASNTYHGLNSTDVGLHKFIAFFSCRYDFSHRACQSCVADAVERMYSGLPILIFFRAYEECVLGYTSSSEPHYGFEGSGKSSERRLTVKEDEGHFIQVLHDTLSKLISNAIADFDKSSRYFALTTAKYSSHETLYALAQCNPDISSSNCTTCLHKMAETNPDGAVYGQSFSPNCRLSYILSTMELRRPWNFQQTYEEIYQTTSKGSRGSATMAAMVAIISIVAITLKPLL